METFDSLTGVWVVPMHALDFQILMPDGTTLEASMIHAESDSTWNVQAINVADFSNGGTRTVGYVCDVVFIPPYTDLGEFWQTIRALQKGRIQTLTLTLQARMEQPKGATMPISDNAAYLINDWTGYIGTNNQMERGRFVFNMHGTFGVDLFDYFNALLHRGNFFGAIVPNI
jgi:hypothetical protein